MRNLSTWLLVMFMIMFWGFRVVATLMTEFTGSFGGMEPINTTYEIILIFITLICILLVIKRKLLGAIIYLLAYGSYFGINSFNSVSALIQGEMLTANGMLSTFMSIIGLIIPLAVFIDLLADRGRKKNPVDEKTDWFFKNEQYDRKYDERADKNNYRTM